MDEKTINHEKFLKREPRDERYIRGIGYVCLDHFGDTENPFVAKQYDFQTGFYRGDFEFPNPLTGEMTVDTPEAYGRYRIVTAMLENYGDRDDYTVLDLGCGTLDIARTVPSEHQPAISMVNADISGPWSSGEGRSSLERGAADLIGENGGSGFKDLVNVQLDFNKSEWPFSEDSMDCIVSNMALHHIAPENKLQLFRDLHATLHEGGILILNDVYQKNEDRAMYTGNGERGPSECKGYPIKLSETLALMAEAGFKMDSIATLAQQDEALVTEAMIESAVKNNGQTIPISNSVWYTILRK